MRALALALALPVLLAACAPETAADRAAVDSLAAAVLAPPAPEDGPGEDVYEHGPFLVRHVRLERDSVLGAPVVRGEVQHTGRRAAPYVEVQLTLRAADRAVVGSALANVENLGAGDRWRFAVPVAAEGAATVEVDGVAAR